MEMITTDWDTFKKSLKADLMGVQESFVRIGYKLRKIEDDELYKRDGFASVVDFAKSEYGLSASTVSRFMAINKKYSIDGYSDCLSPEFAELGSSKLSEMLSLPDSDLQMIKPETTRESIRELKQFNRVAPPTEGILKIRELVESFFKDNRQILDNLYCSFQFAMNDIKGMTEIVNPSGNRSYRKGMYFVMMYENTVMIKKFGADVENISWESFFDITKEIFGADAQSYKDIFGEEKSSCAGANKEDGERENEEDEREEATDSGNYRTAEHESETCNHEETAPEVAGGTEESEGGTEEPDETEEIDEPEELEESEEDENIKNTAIYEETTEEFSDKQEKEIIPEVKCQIEHVDETGEVTKEELEAVIDAEAEKSTPEMPENGLNIKYDTIPSDENIALLNGAFEAAVNVNIYLQDYENEPMPVDKTTICRMHIERVIESLKELREHMEVNDERTT